jgi:IclR family transcriptional regulator, acetate operon repressor
MAVKTLNSALTTLRAIEVLADIQPAGVSALARELAITKSNAQRVLATLAEAGWIADDLSGQGRFQLTARALTVGRSFLDRSGFRQRLGPVLAALRAATDETILFSVRDGDVMVIVDGLESGQSVHASARVGTVHPVAGSAAGLAVLAFAPAVSAADAVTQADLAEVRKRGYALSLGRVNPGVHSVAAPAIDGTGQPYGAVVISAPAQRGSRRRMEQLGSILVTRLRELSLPAAP